MDSRQAKEILMRYRPETTEGADPEFAEALEQARRDPELGRWFAEHRAFQSAIREGFKQLHVPADLKNRILAEYRPAAIVVWWRRSALSTLAASAAVALLSGLVFLRSSSTTHRITR